MIRLKKKELDKTGSEPERVEYTTKDHLLGPYPTVVALLTNRGDRWEGYCYLYRWRGFFGRNFPTPTDAENALLHLFSETHDVEIV